MRLLCCFGVFYWYCVTVTKSQPPATSCITPNGEEASCVSIFSCPIFHPSVSSNDSLIKKFFLDSVCKEGLFMICCGNRSNFTEPTTTTAPIVTNQEEKVKEAKRAFVIEKILPSKTYCGKQHTDDYFYNNSETSVDEFPWLTHIPFSQDHIFSYFYSYMSGCVGVLISKRYVLTHKGCDIQTWYRLKFGQHHIYEDISCIGTPYGDDCTAPVSEVEINEFIKSDTSNIALIRLERNIEYSDYVRPICLPINVPKRPQSGDTVLTSGWSNAEYIDGQYVQIKNRLSHTVLSTKSCEKDNPIANPICGIAQKINRQYVCPRDNGGPIMYRYRNNWYVEAIITGSESCAKHQPVTGERITQETLNWILDNMEP